jgi:hypothetical protein
MDIKDIKNRLTIAEVIKHYGLKADWIFRPILTPVPGILTPL